jgi:hypothetical protein
VALRNCVTECISDSTCESVADTAFCGVAAPRALHHHHAPAATAASTMRITIPFSAPPDRRVGSSGTATTGLVGSSMCAC